MPLRKLIFTVTNDLSFDQRMIRICSSLSKAGYDVTLVGRKRKNSRELKVQPFAQKRINCPFEKGWLFYSVYNIQLLWYLLCKKADLICAIDLDSILPVLIASKIKGTHRVYDAHELFCEMKEIVTRPAIYKTWKKIEQYTVPAFKHAYTVNAAIAAEFKRMYSVDFEIIRSMPVSYQPGSAAMSSGYILYQGAINEGRSFETLIPAMKKIQSKLIICGDGNFTHQLRKLITENAVEDKIELKGMVPPDELRQFTQNASVGITLFENRGLSNYLSLANRFFDYIQAGVPQVCVNYPAYKEINDQYHIASMIEDLSPDTISTAINELLENNSIWQQLHQNCKQAAKELNWQQEEIKLINFYKNIFEQAFTYR